MSAPDELARDLVLAHPASAEHLAVLRERLAVTAQADSVLDVAYRTIDSPAGCLLLAATDVGLVRVAFAAQDHDAVLQSLADRISPRVLRAPARLESAARQLQEYFAGQRRTFAVPLDWRLSAGFRRAVLNQLAGISYGQTVTYAAVARLTGNAGAVRAVGSACATNPLPIVVPCHRVLRSDGVTGRYLGGAEVKQALLALEAHA